MPYFVGWGISYSDICISSSHLLLVRTVLRDFQGWNYCGGGQAIWVCKIGLGGHTQVVGFCEVFHAVIG